MSYLTLVAFALGAVSCFGVMVLVDQLFTADTAYQKRLQRQITREVENILAVKAKAARTYAGPRGVRS